MNPFSLAYNELLYRPLFNLLVGITNIIPGNSIGWAIIIVTLIVRIVLLPSSLHQVRVAQRNQTKMADIQEKLKQVREDHKDDRAKQAEATMALYREAGINPAAGCLPLLIQLPILIALYRVFFTGIGPDTFQYLYGFVAEPENVQTAFFGLNLTEPSVLLGVIAGIGQFILMRAFTPTPAVTTDDNSAAMMQSMQRNMTYIFPAMTVFIALQVPAALALYWVASTLFAIIQQYLVKKFFNVTTHAAI